MKKKLFLGLALVLVSTANAMFTHEFRDFNSNMRRNFGREMGGMNRALEAAAKVPSRSLIQGGPSHRPIFKYESDKDKLATAEKLIGDYLKRSHDNALTKQEQKHILSILGNKTQCPPGNYRETCGQCSCTETETTCQCLTDKGELKKTSHSRNLKPYQYLENINGSLKAQTYKVSNMGHYKSIPSDMSVNQKFTLKSAYGRPFDSWSLSVEEGKQHITVKDRTIIANKAGRAVVKLTGRIGDKTLEATKVITVAEGRREHHTKCTEHFNNMDSHNCPRICKNMGKVFHRIKRGLYRETGNAYYDRLYKGKNVAYCYCCDKVKKYRRVTTVKPKLIPHKKHHKATRHKASETEAEAEKLKALIKQYKKTYR